jgi:predicted HAD superfamily Cof-like phosphohydrolase
MNRHLYSHYQLLVQDFHEMVGSYTGEWPHVPPEPVQQLRINLLSEELAEYVRAARRGNVVQVADALADLLYVVYGTALAWGIGMAPIFTEVQRSNMSKLGSKMRSDGKVLKPTNGQFSPPELEPLLMAQIPGEGSRFHGLR